LAENRDSHQHGHYLHFPPTSGETQLPSWSSTPKSPVTAYHWQAHLTSNFLLVLCSQLGKKTPMKHLLLMTERHQRLFVFQDRFNKCAPSLTLSTYS